MGLSRKYNSVGDFTWRSLGTCRPKISWSCCVLSIPTADLARGREIVHLCLRLTHNTETSIRSRSHYWSLWIWRGAIFDSFRTPVTCTLMLTVGKNLPSSITHRPLPTYQVSSRSEEKSVDGRTDGHRVRFYKVISFRRWPKNRTFFEKKIIATF